MASMTIHAACPHCGEPITMNLKMEEGVERVPKGPEPFIFDKEIEEFIIEAIEVYRSSFRAVGELLEEREILTPRGSKRWFPATVKRQYESALTRRAQRDQRTATQ